MCPSWGSQGPDRQGRVPDLSPKEPQGYTSWGSAPSTPALLTQFPETPCEPCSASPPGPFGPWCSPQLWAAHAHPSCPTGLTQSHHTHPHPAFPKTPSSQGHSQPLPELSCSLDPSHSAPEPQVLLACPVSTPLSPCPAAGHPLGLSLGSTHSCIHPFIHGMSVPTCGRPGSVSWGNVRVPSS